MSDENITVGDIGKERVVLPSSYTSGPRHLKQKMQDCLALVRRYGKPDFKCEAVDFLVVGFRV